MKPAFAHLSPTVAAILAAAIGISLSAFLLPGAAVDGGPMPLLPAIGGAAGRVIAELPAPANERTSEPVRKAASTSQLVATLSEHFLPQRPQVATKAHRVHHRARIRVAPKAPSAPAQVVAPAPPTTPVKTGQFFSTSTKGKGKALGKARGKARGKALGKARGHARGPRPTAGAPAPSAPGQETPRGRSSEQHHGHPPRPAKKPKLPTAPSPPPAAAPKANGGGPPTDKKQPSAPSPPPAAAPKANGGGPPTDNGGGNGHKGGKK